MHKTIAVLLGIVCFLPVIGESQGGLKQTPRMPATSKRFFLTMMIGCPSPILPNPP
ncbi:hypothetical protein SEEN2TTA_22172, partial [Salmonella enterica subsp. enterica serovar Newport str. Pond080-2TTA]